MSRAELIYPLRKQMQRELAKIEQDVHNRDLLLRYYKVRSTEVRLATVLQEFIRLNTLSRMLGKPFEDANLQDMEDLVFRIDQRDNADNTKNKFRKILKSFFRWMKGCPKGEYPPEVRWIAMKRLPLVTVTAEDLIPFDEVVRISELAIYVRDKALIQCKLDAGCRIGEILTVKIGEVHFNDGGAVLYSDGKTGYQPLILTWSAKTLAQWLNVHPFRDDKEAPVFCLLDRAEPMQLTYAAAVSAFKKCVKKAGYADRRIWFHLLKHVSSTEDSRRGMPDSFRRFKHHWTPNSKMPAVYEHLSKSDIPAIQKDTWQRIAGVEVKAEQAEPPQAIELMRKCRRCDYENSRDSAFCNRCGYQLDDKAASEHAVGKSKAEELVERLSEKPDLVEKLLSVIKP